MLNPKPTTCDSSRLLTRWNLAIGEALTGAEKVRAVALVKVDPMVKTKIVEV